MNSVVVIAVIVAAVVGGVVGSNAAKDDDDGSSGDHKKAIAEGSGSPGDVVTAFNEKTVYPLDTDGNPIYPTASKVATAEGAKPTTTANNTLSCDNDPFSPSSQDADTFEVRPDHPVLFAPSHKWECLADQIAADPSELL